MDLAGHRHLDSVRPHPDHPRQRRGHAAHAHRHRDSGDARGVRVPAARGGDARRRRDGAAVARRDLRDDVGRGLLDRQPVADGARRVGRVRGRRRHRHDRELLPQPREGHAAFSRCLGGRQADRLHRALDQHLAGRSLHPAPVHDRCGRPRVPGILGHARLRDRGVDGRVADRDADDLRALRAPAAEPGRHLVRPPGRARAGRNGAFLRPHAERRAQPPGPDTVRDGRDHHHHLPVLRADAQGLFPAGRYRPDFRGHRRLARDLVPGHVRPAAAGGSNRARRPRGCRSRLLDRLGWMECLGESGQHVHQPQAARGTRRHQHADGGGEAAPKDRRHSGAARVLLRDAGRAGRRPPERLDLPVHALGHRLWRAPAMGATYPGKNPVVARTCRRLDRSRAGRAAGQRVDRPDRGLAARRARAGHRKLAE